MMAFELEVDDGVTVEIELWLDGIAMLCFEFFS
jgi:hypothetical protein